MRLIDTELGFTSSDDVSEPETDVVVVVFLSFGYNRIYVCWVNAYC